MINSDLVKIGLQVLGTLPTVAARLNPRPIGNNAISVVPLQPSEDSDVILGKK